MPNVSIIVPCFNEESTILQLLEAIDQQDFPHRDFETIVADGLSTDNTRSQIETFKKTHTDLQIGVIDNPSRLIPAALNRAIAAAHGEIILRLDAHCVPQPDYMTRSVAALVAGKGWNVGGVWDLRPSKKSWIASAIAIAASHPLGVGDAWYRFTGKAGEVDTVPFGAFRRSLVEKIGGFDESLLTNEDYEFNARIRQAGGRVWLDPAIRSVYYARPDLAALARQYARYGYWKGRMLRRNPKTLRARQAIPALFVLSLLALPLLSLVWPPALQLLLFEMVLYVSLLLGVALILASKHKQVSLLLGIPLAMITMHLSWGAAFLWSVISSPFDQGATQTNG